VKLSKKKIIALIIVLPIGTVAFLLWKKFAGSSASGGTPGTLANDTQAVDLKPDEAAATLTGTTTGGSELSAALIKLGNDLKNAAAKTPDTNDEKPPSTPPKLTLDGYKAQVSQWKGVLKAGIEKNKESGTIPVGTWGVKSTAKDRNKVLKQQFKDSVADLKKELVS
jgi:hypothetical protein